MADYGRLNRHRCSSAHCPCIATASAETQVYRETVQPGSERANQACALLCNWSQLAFCVERRYFRPLRCEPANSPAVLLRQHTAERPKQTFLLAFENTSNAGVAHANWPAEVSSSKRASQEHPNCIATVQPAKVCPFRDLHVLCRCASSVAAASTRQTSSNQLMSAHQQVALLLLEACCPSCCSAQQPDTCTCTYDDIFMCFCGSAGSMCVSKHGTGASSSSSWCHGR